MGVQVTLVIRAFAVRVFAYPRFYFRIMQNISILSAVTVEAAAQARSFTDSPHHFDSRSYKLRPFMVHHSENTRACRTYSVLRVFDIRGDLQETTSRV
jgi:hypothetical protein